MLHYVLVLALSTNRTELILSIILTLNIVFYK